MNTDREWPSIAAIVPTRDRPELLARAVRAILDQKYGGEIECVVVFDQSEPTPVDVPTGDRRRITLVRNDRTPGLAGARNSGVVASRSDLVAFCDDDDEWLPGKIGHQVALLDDRPDVPLVASGILVNFRDTDRLRLAPGRDLTQVDFLRDRIMEVNPCTALIRREAMTEIGLVDEKIPGGYGEDYEWLLRATANRFVASVPAPLVRVNWHASSFFADRWRTIVAALHYLLDRYPQFDEVPEGRARLHGQLAFAHAALGERREARQWARRALSDNWREQRAIAALLVASHLISATTFTRLAHRFGRGV